MFAHWTIALVFCSLLAQVATAQQQVVDPDFKPAVASPAYASGGPVVAIDEAHQNFHTATGNYRPFAELLRADGYRVRASTSKLSAETFKGVDIFVVVNAEGTFAGAEADALRDWVKAGGSLLLTADHEPFGAAMESLGLRFGVSMGKGRAYDSEVPGRITTQLTYSRANGLLGEHPILEGRNASERVNLVKTFTGQSLGLPQGASPLLRFGATAREAVTVAQLNQVGEAIARNEVIAGGPPSVAGRVQGLAMPFGKGRIVVLGEAGMFSAQAVKFPPGSGQQDFKFGMNLPGTDDRQFALNVLHWLSRVIG
ncbi:MAG: DUF4350 domain-containing protein [Hyphomonadaceae bacterium]|nr:DUF4350 domain-containing protein [Hyphomonadaceae bacterium]